MASAPGVADASPVHALIPRGKRDQDVAGIRRPERRPKARQAVRIGLAVEPAVSALQTQHPDAALEVPPGSTPIGDLRSGPKPKLAPVALQHRLGAIAVEIRQPGHEVHSLQRAKRRPDPRQLGFAPVVVSQ